MRKLGCLVLLVVLAGVAAFFIALQGWGGRGPLERPLTYDVRPGASVASAATDLERQGAIGSAQRFRLFARVFGSGAGLRAGEYRIPAHMSASDILKLLQGGRTMQRLVTIPEGLPSVMVRDVLMHTEGLSGTVAVPPEGSVLPDSYAFERGESRQAVLARMQRAMTSYLGQAWAHRQPGIAVTTPEQALTLAAIVEKETGKPDERRLVAAVYSNRLRQNMMLQADPTIIYPITQGRPLGRRILRSEVEAHNTYNTYAMTGLPVGPICNPGRASIDAVLNPATSNALYFVADGSGGHVFADTLEQHNANVARWREFRAQHGI